MYKARIMVWAAGAALCLVNQPLKLWIAPLVITNVIVSMLFTALGGKVQPNTARKDIYAMEYSIVYGRKAEILHHIEL